MFSVGFIVKASLSLLFGSCADVCWKVSNDNVSESIPIEYGVSLSMFGFDNTKKYFLPALYGTVIVVSLVSIFVNLWPGAIIYPFTFASFVLSLFPLVFDKCEKIQYLSIHCYLHLLL